MPKRFGYSVEVPKQSAPSTPATGFIAVYAKSDGKLYIKDDAGVETDITTAGGGKTYATRVAARSTFR